MPFELALRSARAQGRPALYCYRPLTDEFIQLSAWERCGQLPSHRARRPRVWTGCNRPWTCYLRGTWRGVKITGRPNGFAARLALAVFLELRLLRANRSSGLSRPSSRPPMPKLERCGLRGSHCTATVIAPLRGVAHWIPPPPRSRSGEGLSLIRGDALADAPRPRRCGETGDEPNVVALVAIARASDADGTRRWPIARTQLPAGAECAAPVRAWRLRDRPGRPGRRTEAGSWRSDGSDRGQRPASRMLTLVPAAQEDELRAFFRLV